MTERYETSFFSSLTNQLSVRAARAFVSKLSPVSKSLRKHLRNLLEKNPGELGAFLADPVFEAAFGWESQSNTMLELTPSLLDSRLVQAMDSPPPQYAENRFGADRFPYKHQVESWRLLKEDPPRSVVISSGTGSGKTECFFVPILDDLARRLDGEGPLVGVRALLLYPLNALINSQRDRLRAWTAGFNGRIRFCLYNGETPEVVQANNQRNLPQEVLSRKLLRKEPPPILVTNSTMLEYMLVRQQDRSIIERSEGKLKWIILDEAHTYVGSNAAEISLLLRRVMHAFKVNPGEVRFVATSATIGSDRDLNAKENLQQYLADIAGVDASNVHVVTANREVPEIPDLDPSEEHDLPPINALREMTPEKRFDVFVANKISRMVRHNLIDSGPMTLTEIASIATGKEPLNLARADKEYLLHFLDVCRSARLGENTFLPLRMHAFQRTQVGIWVCCNSKCPGIEGTSLANSDWAFGKVFLERRDVCDIKTCGAKSFELVLCETCGAEYLSTEEYFDGEKRYLRQRTLEASDDEEELLVDEEEEDMIELDDSYLDYGFPRLLCGASNNGTEIDVTTGQIDPPEGGVSHKLILPEEDGALRCPRCGQKEMHAEAIFRPARAGAPFFLRVAMPTLLEHTNPISGREKELPFGGRRIITFSDSRQGTATFALQSQIEAERNYVRSFLYHLVATNRTASDPDEIDRISSQISELEGVEEQTPILQSVLKDLQKKLLKLQEPGSPRIKWHDAVNQLAQTREISEWMPDHWHHTGLGQFSPSELARFCLFREFARRPKRQNSLETLGMIAIRYPAIEELSESNAPTVWRQLQLPIDEWKNFLKIALDFLVRARSAVNIPDEHYRWVGIPIRSRFIVGPEGLVASRRVFAWPQVNSSWTRSRLVLLLSRALKLDLANAEERENINELLRTAWIQLQPMFNSLQEGAKLDLDSQAALEIPSEIWLCPLTRRALDTTFFNLTPYLTQDIDVANAMCEKVEFPSLPTPFWRDEMGKPVDHEEINTWLETEASINDLREKGIWTEFSDRIASFSPYFRIAEHSAQQESPRLRNLEKQFKEANLNVLSCSTTMELGVDIGGVSAVGMNNAPPSPANFLQRAGRAGRRGESAAVSLTMCKSTPHGEAVFSNPLWPFQTPIHLPQVSLQSRRVVQRHINSLALTRFLSVFASDLTRLKSGWFFQPEETGVTAPVDRMKTWLRKKTGALTDDWLLEGLVKLTARSVLAGIEPLRLLQETENVLTNTTSRWRQEVEALEEEFSRAGGVADEERTPAQMAIFRQLIRIKDEYLLSELASKGFLPGYGFPTDVVPFVNSTLEQLKRERHLKHTAGDREDNWARRRGYPTRDLPLALRDYAPGNDIVIDGQVFRSEGVTLNWHIPAGDTEIRETQAVLTAWRCRACGASGAGAVRPPQCPTCDSDAGNLMYRNYLQPAGFAVSLYYRPHNDLSFRRFIPVQSPWITAGQSPWLPLPQPEFGRYRYSQEGHVLHQCGGVSGFGFAICLKCGRAASETCIEGEGELPVEMREHHRLRGGKEPDGRTRCQGNDEQFAIKRNLWLGFATYTDVFELQLNDHSTGAPIREKTVLLSLAVALRQGLSEELGITDREIGFATVPSRSSSGSQTLSLILYDTAAGGAGFVSSAPSNLPSMMMRAREILDCSRGCDRACHSCLLTYDTQYDVDNLDRKQALTIISENFLQGLDLPRDLCFFGESSRLEFDDLSSAISREMQRVDSQEIRVYLGGHENLWDTLEWPLKSQLLSWASEGRKVNLLISRIVLESLDPAVSNPLSSLSEVADINIVVYEGQYSHETIPTLAAEVVGKHRSIRWATSSTASLAPGIGWGRAEDSDRVVRISSSGLLESIQGTLVEPATIRKSPPGTFKEAIITDELNGNIKEFGSRFWEIIYENYTRLADKFKRGESLKTITYNDRYLNNPINIRLLYEWLEGLKNIGPIIADDTHLTVNTCLLNKRNRFNAKMVHHDWLDENKRKEVMRGIISSTMMNVTINVAERHESSHIRELILSWADGTSWICRLDHGLGFMHAARNYPFDFYAEPGVQIQKLLKQALSVKNAVVAGSHIYINEIG